jgi:uncharacterized protein
MEGRMRGKRGVLVIAGLLFASYANAQSPSFNCAKASQAVEKLICGSATLSSLDAKMAVAFKSALEAPGPHRTALIEAQRQWLLEWRAICPMLPDRLPTIAERLASENCVAARYQQRTAELTAEAEATKVDDGLCSSLAHRLEATAANGLPEGIQRMPIRGLAAAGDGFVRIDEGDPMRSRDEIAETPRTDFHASPELLDVLEGMSGEGWWLPRLGHTSIYAVKSVAGTMNCSRFLFFATPPGSLAASTKGPSIVEEADESAFCWKTVAWLGEVAGQPAFLTESDGDANSYITIAPRLGDSWTEACSLTVTFAANFEVTGTYCGVTADCGALTGLAKSIAMQFDQDPKNWPPARGLPDRPEFAAKMAEMRQLAEAAGWNITVPTFGEEPDTDYASFGPDSVLFPINLKDQSYLARLGHGSRGWRESPDYLLAIYRLGDGALEPVAGFHIAKTRGNLISATVDP